MFLPLPENQIKGRKFCTRYRDAIELTKKCDALVFIVSVKQENLLCDRWTPLSCVLAYELIIYNRTPDFPHNEKKEINYGVDFYRDSRIYQFFAFNVQIKRQAHESAVIVDKI
jgi:hypothetical protein